MFEKNNTKYVIGIIALFYLVGVIGLSLETTRDLFTKTISVTIIMSNVLIILYHHPKKLSYVFVFSAIIVSGFLIEVIGVKTGIIFGGYFYGAGLGFKLFQTPPLIGFNWAMLVYMVWMIVKDWKINLFLKVTSGATLMVIYDIVLEPFAINYGMWTWEDNVPPVQNYIAWFVIAFVFLLIVSLSKLTFRNKIAVPLFFTQLIFFTILLII